MQRTFKLYSIAAAGTPQPLLGTNLSASVVPSLNSANQQVSCPVADSSMFTVGDYVLFQTPAGSNQERVPVVKIPDGTHITVAFLGSAHTGGVAGTGDWVSLALPVNSIYVQCNPGNGGAIFLGTSPAMVKATGAFCFVQLVQTAAGVQPVDFNTNQSRSVNIDNTSQVFVDGTTADKYLPSIWLI